MAYVVEGSLDGAFGPWLAQGPEGRVVLRRRQGPVVRTGHAAVADVLAVLSMDGREYEVEPYVPGSSLEDRSLDDPHRMAVMAWVARGLAALHRAGVGHGALSLGRIRVGMDGSVRIVGARRGEPLADEEALRALARQLWPEIPPDVEAVLDEGNAAWMAVPASCLPPCPVKEPSVQSHALTGIRFELSPRAEGESSERPPKVQAALFAGATLILGLLAGAFLAGCSSSAPRVPVEVTVHVPGAIQIAAYCGGDHTYRTQGPNQDTLTFEPDVGDTTTCELEAPLSPVMPLRGQLLLSQSSWSYTCEREGVELVCRDVERRP